MDNICCPHGYCNGFEQIYKEFFNALLRAQAILPPAPPIKFSPSYLSTFLPHAARGPALIVHINQVNKQSRVGGGPIQVGCERTDLHSIQARSEHRIQFPEFDDSFPP